MAETPNMAAARSYFERVLNQGDMNVADDIFNLGIKFHYPMGDLDGAVAVKDYVRDVRTAFPDICFTIEDIFGEWDRITTRWSLAGSQTGSFREQEPTGQRAELPGITIFQVNQGQIDEMWNAFNPAQLISN